jgi:outer membrane protein, adhesin transport system
VGILLLTDAGSRVTARQGIVSRAFAATGTVTARVRVPAALLAILLVPILTISTTSSAQAVTLKQELLLLLQQHPQLRAARDSVAAAGEGVNFADSLFLPSVSLNGDTGYKMIDNPTSRAAGKDFGRGFEKLTMTVTQNIFDGSRKDHDKNTAELNREAVAGSYEETRQGLLLQAANLYIDVLRQIQLTRLARKSESTIAYQLDLEDERVKRGGGTAVDVLLSKTRLQRTKEQRVVFEGNLRDSVTRYTLMFGHPPDVEKMEPPKLDPVLVPTDIDAAISAGLAANPLIENSNRQIDIARMQHRSAQSEYFPRVDVVGAANYEDDREGTVGNRRDYSVTVQATWNLFSGFATRSSVAEAAYNYSSTINNHLFVNRRIEEEARLAWQAMMTACNRRLLLVNAVFISSEVHASRVRLREAGEETVINVLDSEGEVFNAEINETAAVFDEILATYRLSNAMGLNLVDVLDREYTPEVKEEAKKVYEERCVNRLKTVALNKSDDDKPRESANPFAAPKKGEDAEEAANPFASPEKGAKGEDEEASNPFAAPAEEEDGVKTEDDSEASTTNPFASEDSDDENRNGTDDDDGLSLRKQNQSPQSGSIEEDLDEDDDSISKSLSPTEDDDSIEPAEDDKSEFGDEVDDDLNDNLTKSDKISVLMKQQPTDETDTEWDDELKSETQ